MEGLMYKKIYFNEIKNVVGECSSEVVVLSVASEAISLADDE
jgi:hypothetical protein